MKEDLNNLKENVKEGNFCALRAYVTICQQIEIFEALKEELQPLAIEVADEEYPNSDIIRLGDAIIRKLPNLLIVSTDENL